MWNSFALPVPSEAPLQPDATEARQWALDELARSAYHPDQSLFTRLGRWLAELLESLLGGASGGAGPLLGLILAAALLAVVALALRHSRRAAHSRPGRTASLPLFPNSRSAAALRQAAGQAAASGDLTSAFLDTYRALIRSLDERTLLEERPGLTAREAARLAAIPYPQHAQDLRWASNTFDGACYGHLAVTGPDLNGLQLLDAAISHTQPLTRPEVVPT